MEWKCYFFVQRNGFFCKVRNKRQWLRKRSFISFS
nr:MAG TPA: hypothetical protein [Caudoviricetes sp.]